MRKTTKKKNEIQLKYKNLYQERFWADPNSIKVLTKGLKEGRDLKVSCESIGIAKPLYDNALKEGYRCVLLKPDNRTEDENLLANFYIECKQAVSEFETGAIGSIIKAARYGDWKAAAWLLERRMPETYGKRELPPLQTGEDNRATSVKVEIIHSHDEATENRLARLENEVKVELGKESAKDVANAIDEAKQ
jgi:hypothetical protein